MSVKTNTWTNGSYTLSWEDEDHVKITSPFLPPVIMCGGDFEFCLQALCAAYQAGKQKAEESIP